MLLPVGRDVAVHWHKLSGVPQDLAITGAAPPTGSVFMFALVALAVFGDRVGRLLEPAPGDAAGAEWTAR